MEPGGKDLTLSFIKQKKSERYAMGLWEKREY